MESEELGGASFAERKAGSSSVADLSDVVLASARGSGAEGSGSKQEASASSPWRPRVVQGTGPHEAL